MAINKEKAAKAKKTVKKSTPAVPQPEPVKAPPSRRIPRGLMVVVAVFLLLGLAFVVRRYLIAAKVTDRYISRLTVIRELEKQGGKQVLDSLIVKTLIMQEANKKEVNVSGKEVEDEIKGIEAELKQQGRNLEDTLLLQGMTRESLKEQILVQKTLEKLLADKIRVSDKEVEDFISENQAELPEGLTDAELRSQAKEQLKNQKLNDEAQKLLQDLRNRAEIQYFLNY